MLLAALALAGCGDDAPTTADAPPTRTPTPAEPTATQAGDSDPTATINKEFQTASTDGYDIAAGVYTDAGKERLGVAADAWERYLEAEPKPDPRLASLMVGVYGPGALSDLDRAVAAQEIVVASQPKESSAFAQLAVLAYGAGQDNKGVLAARRAVELAPKDQRAVLREQLGQIAKTCSNASCATSWRGEL